MSAVLLRYSWRGIFKCAFRTFHFGRVSKTKNASTFLLDKMHAKEKKLRKYIYIFLNLPDPIEKARDPAHLTIEATPTQFNVTTTQNSVCHFWIKAPASIINVK